jgi:hypothetical protein
MEMNVTENAINNYGIFYFILQGILGTLWWAMLFISSDFAQLFALYPDRLESVFSFMMADIPVFLIGSILAAWMIYRQHAQMLFVVYLVNGGLLFTTLFLINHFIRTGNSIWSIILMIPACVITFYFALKLKKA